MNVATARSNCDRDMIMSTDYFRVFICCVLDLLSTFRQCDGLIPNLSIATKRGFTDSISELEQGRGRSSWKQQ